MTAKCTALLAEAFLGLASFAGVAYGNEFTMPVDGNLFLQQMGGEAGGVTSFGLGTSPGNFDVLYTGLPNNPDPVGEVLAGFFTAGTTIHFGEFTTFAGLEGYAFSNGTDQASLVAFSDIDNSLGMGGSIIQQTGQYTWLLHLDDAVSYLYDDDDNDVLMQLQVVPVPEAATAPLMAQAVLGIVLLVRLGLLRSRFYEQRMRP